MNPYPTPFDHAAFPKIPDAVLAKPKVPEARVANIGVEAQSALKIPASPDAIVTGLWIQAMADTEKRSASFQSKEPERNGPADSSGHFCFVPGVDNVEIRWVVWNPDKAVKSRFELWSAAINSQEIWAREYSGAEAVRVLEGPDHFGDGPLAWTEVQIPGDAVHFPGQCPNATYGPYQLRLTVTSERGSVTTAWTYFDVLVHGIEMHWGPAAWIPAQPIPEVSPILQPLTAADEPALLMKLKGQHRTTDPEQNAIPATGNIPIRLRSTMASYISFGEWQGFHYDFAYLRHRARWGAGPRIPILAKIFLRRIDGSKLDPDAPAAAGTWAQAGAALGPARCLWDWHDRTLADRTNDENRLNPDAGAFVLRALGYKPNTGNEPPDCLNCHIDRGGKRGGTALIFPDQPGTGSLPFTVRQATVRRWAALSNVPTSGPNACRTGVLFNPSRMAKDTYRVTVMLATQCPRGSATPLVDAGGKIDALVADHPGLPNASSGMLEIIRLVNARYIRKANYAQIDLHLIRRSYEVAGVDVEWLNLVDPTFTGQWTKADWDRYLQEALSKAGRGFSDQQIRSQRYSGASPEDWKGKRYKHIDEITGTGALNHYDHWYGCRPGATHPQPSEVCFTFPSRDVVVAPFKDSAIQGYINKPRRINDKKKKWLKLKGLNPTMADATLREQFYNALGAKSQRKIDGAAAELYHAAGWKSFDENRPNQWALDNFPHTNGPVDLLAESHQLMIMDDAYQGVTFFHYTNILETRDAADHVVGNYFGLGGVAKCDTSVDLGLKSLFFVWDHPTDGRRGANMLPPLVMMNGNVTAVHEFGHNLHLPHSFNPTTNETYNLSKHDGKPPTRADTGAEPGPARQCVMNYHLDSELCGACRLRLRGWAMLKVDSRNLAGFDSVSPDQPGEAPLPYKALLRTFFTDLTT